MRCWLIRNRTEERDFHIHATNWRTAAQRAVVTMPKPDLRGINYPRLHGVIAYFELCETPKVECGSCAGSGQVAADDYRPAHECYRCNGSGQVAADAETCPQARPAPSGGQIDCDHVNKIASSRGRVECSDCGAELSQPENAPAVERTQQPRTADSATGAAGRAPTLLGAALMALSKLEHMDHSGTYSRSDNEIAALRAAIGAVDPAWL